MKCYTFDKLIFKHGVYDESIDATYIITLEDNVERHKNIIKQLKNFRPTKIVYIVLNKGFKKCEKNLIENKSTFDLIHCNLEIFKHSLEKEYSNILVLEDDFIVEERAKDINHINEINNFCLKRKNSLFTLSLGSIPIILLPHSYKFRLLLWFFGAHAMIYSKKYRLYALENKDDIYKSKDWDEYMNFKSYNYSYYKSLITQTFPETENQKNWPKHLGLTDIGLKLIDKMKLNKQTQPGFDTLNIIAHIFSFLLTILIIWLLFKFVRKLNR